MLKKFIRLVGGDPNKREIERHSETVEQINALEQEFEGLTDEALRAKTAEFRARLQEGEALDDLLPEAFAAVREASKRTIGLRHYDVQMVGGIVLHQGKIAEMRTGEGKTLVATLPLYLNALPGKGAHLITVNDYLARRDARWMAPIYNLLGLSVGVLQMAARTENGKKAFVVDLERESPHEDQHQLRMTPRQEAYQADITYGTNSEFGFDYLRDNMTMRWDERVQRGHHYAIVDEVDNVLIDEARTPLIISGPAQDEAEWYIRVAQVVKALRAEDYEISEKDRTVTLTELGEGHVEELLQMSLRDPDRPEDVTLEQARMLGYLEQALRAQHLYRRNKDYLVQAGKVVIVDEFTGRLMPGRRWSDGLHQAVEAKEGVKVQSESVTYATITIQNYFRMYKKLAGMSGTAITESEEFDKIYKLGVLSIPTNLEFQASLTDSSLEELEGRDESGYKYNYYARKGDPLKEPVYWRRKDYPDVVYRTEEAKLRAIAREILRDHALGRPLLVGTTSVELSERLANRLRAEPLRRLAQVMLLRDAWVRANNYQEDGRLIAELQFLNEPLDKLDISAMRKLARELDIPFNPEEPANLSRLLALMELPEGAGERLTSDLMAGISNEVLNARKHTEESQIIAGAGAFGAVTIATNMAGRGVDIKLGGELAEEIVAAVNRVLHRAGFGDPYDMNHLERYQALTQMDTGDYGIYEPEVSYFLRHVEEMEQVRELGGLHVIGSERHEARRIDNQLRGRSARQGDPGSSRFYLSMEDELMRLFGGQQADSLMQRMKWDDALPLELGLVGRLVEQAQTRVEGNNFDIRKHLLEYDDVLNTQRAKIYMQRDRIFSKDDLTEDVTQMLRDEVARRVPEALKDEGGPWKLIAWLDQIQPSIHTGGYILFPSYSLRLLLNKLVSQLPSPANVGDLRAALLDLASRALEAEREHLLKSVTDIMEQQEDRLEAQIADRLEGIDNFFESLDLEEESEGAPVRRPAELITELSNLARIPIKLSPEEQRKLITRDKDVAEEVRNQVRDAITTQTITRLVGTIERRLDESLDLDASDLRTDNWRALTNQVLDAVEATLDRRRERFLGSESPAGLIPASTGGSSKGAEAGQIVKDLDATLERMQPGAYGEQALMALLVQMPQGARATFDRRTHRRVFQRTTRLNYSFLTAQFLGDRKPDDIAADVLEHLEGAQRAIRRAWGLAELSRLGNASLAELDEAARNSILEVLGSDQNDALVEQPLDRFNTDQREIITDELGRRALTGIYRQLLLGVITELWVEYLTQVEALRVSIGLEAYGQRDPLVQYKNRAYELFQNLQRDIRQGLVTRMFTYRPHDLSGVQTGLARAETPQLQAEVETEQAEEVVPEKQPVSSKPEQAPARVERSDKKRKRRRH